MKMKKIIAVLLAISALLSVLVLSGCSVSGVEVPDGMKVVSSENEAFYLFVPISWVSNDSSGTASAYYSDADRSNVSMTCMASDQVMNIDDYVALCRAELEAVIPNYAPAGEIEDAVLGGRNGKSFDYTASIGDVNYKYRQIVVIYNNLFYIFTYTSTPEGFDLHINEVENIISKIRFK